MRSIQLTKGQVALVDDEDFEYLIQWKWAAKYYPKAKTFYAERKYRKDGKLITLRMHRVIMNTTDSNVHIDHINHNGLYNYKNNLRRATPQQNQCNRRSASNSTSKYLGVCWHKYRRKWQANIRVDNKSKYLGLFISEEQAAKEYDLAAKQYHNEFANINFH